MNLAEPFIRRPVMTTLVMSAFIIFGLVGFRLMPVNALPNIDFPTISVTAELPGLKKEDVAIQFENGVLTISGEKKLVPPDPQPPIFALR